MSRNRDHTVPTSEKFDFEDEVAFVSGAAGGIGRATALAFAREGTDVAVAGIGEVKNQETTDMIEDTGSDSLAVTCDLRESEDVQASLDATIGGFGRLDYACNNAGVEQGPEKTADPDGDEGTVSLTRTSVASSSR